MIKNEILVIIKQDKTQMFEFLIANIGRKELMLNLETTSINFPG